MRSPLARPMLLAAAAFTAGGGYVHLDEWLDTYRDVPADAPGAWLVRVGFPVNAGLSLLVAVGLVLAATRLPTRMGAALAAAAAFQAGSLAFLIGSRTGTVLGWTEPVWTAGAERSRAVEMAALGALLAASLLAKAGARVPHPSAATASA